MRQRPRWEIRVKLRLLSAVLTLALSASMTAGAANAAQYLLTVNGCSSNCMGSNSSIGVINVTQDAALAGVLDFSIVLTNGAKFNVNGKGRPTPSCSISTAAGPAWLA